MIKFYLDENVPVVIATGLQRRGINAITCRDAKTLGLSDVEHIEYAANENRVVFTQDDDFVALHATGISHKGIVYAHQRKSIGEIIRRLVLIYQVLDPVDMVNHVEFV